MGPFGNNKPVHVAEENKEQNDLRNELKEEVKIVIEISCIKSCSLNFLKLREFVEVQLFEDWESIKKKNQIILDDET